MALSLRASDINFIKPLHRLVYFFGLIPPYNAPQGFKKTLYKCHAILVVLFLFVMAIISLYGKITRTFVKQSVTVIVIDVIANLVQVASIVVAIIRSTFTNGNSFRSFTKIFIQTDELLESHKIPCNTCYKFYIEIIVTHIFVILLFSYDVYFWMSVEGFMTYMTHFLQDTTVYLNMVSVLLVYNYVKALRYRFSVLNDRLETTKSKFLTCPTMYGDEAEGKKTSEKVNQAREIYTQLNVLIRIFNNLFGWQIFFLCAIVVMVVLEIINFTIVSVEFGEISKESVHLKLQFLLLGFLWCTTLVIMGVVVAVSCDETVQEAQRTPILCYEFLLCVPTESNNGETRLLRKELELLAQQSSNQCPYFSAAGFFYVNYNMIFGLFGTITSYIIVLIQINGK